MLKILTFFNTRTGSLLHTRLPSLFVITPYPAVVAMYVTAEVEPNFITEEDPIYSVISVQIKETLILKSFMGTFAKLRKATFSFIISVRQAVCLTAWKNSAPSGLIFFLNLVFAAFLKIFRENSSLIKIFQV
jgi:hypothetical protein